MKSDADFSPLCQSFFSKRLMAQRKASPAQSPPTRKRSDC